MWSWMQRLKDIIWSMLEVGFSLPTHVYCLNILNDISFFVPFPLLLMTKKCLPIIFNIQFSCMKAELHKHVLLPTFVMPYLGQFCFRSLKEESYII